jgi:hypothetical protein
MSILGSIRLVANLPLSGTMKEKSKLTQLQSVVDKGPIYFIIVRGIIVYGLIFLVGQLLIRFFISEKPLTTEYYLTTLAISIVAGLVFGVITWPSNERKLRKLKRERNITQ